MQAIRNFINNTLFGGVFFLLPLLVLLYVAKEAWTFFQKLGDILTKYLGIETLAGMASKSIMAVVLILMLCFFSGLLARWSIASLFRQQIESTLQRFIPHYDYYRAIVEQKLKLTAQEVPSRPTVLVRQLGGWQPGVLVDTYPSGEQVVFLPGSPKTTDGTVLVVGSDDIRQLDMPESALYDVLLKNGAGLLG
jgi:uncharacterized membrane protein